MVVAVGLIVTAVVVKMLARQDTRSMAAERQRSGMVDSNAVETGEEEVVLVAVAAQEGAALLRRGCSILRRPCRVFSLADRMVWPAVSWFKSRVNGEEAAGW